MNVYMHFTYINYMLKKYMRKAYICDKRELKYRFNVDKIVQNMQQRMDLILAMWYADYDEA